MHKPRNSGTMTEAAYWGKVRSVLRSGFRYWKPISKCREAAKRAYRGPNSRQKWEYQCNACKGWFKGSDVQVDHIVPCGSLKGPEDLVGFLERLTVEDGFQCLCKPCHNIKTQNEKGNKNVQQAVECEESTPGTES